MTIVAEQYPYVVGVDTHARTHQLAIIATHTGQLIDHAEFPTHPAGLARAVDWIIRRTGQPAQVLISAEGTNSYGRHLTDQLTDAGFRVVDAPATPRRPGQDKNDHLDAVAAARTALARDLTDLADARHGELHAAVRVLVCARRQMVGERTRTYNAITALLRTTDLGIDARTKPTRDQIRTIAGWRTRTTDTLAVGIARADATRLARRILALDHDSNTNTTHLHQLINHHVPALLDQPGVGPVTAAVVLAVWSHPGRIRTAAAFAKIAGTSPVQIASGNNDNHRLNRGGDRHLNQAIHTIAITRIRHDPATRAYLTRRTAEGLTKARVRRCLKRYIARQLHRTLTNTMT